jgi:hypothetical protein
LAPYNVFRQCVQDFCEILGEIPSKTPTLDFLA